MNIAITKISSKGQVVIPAEMRRDLNEGDKLIVFKSRDHIIMKLANKLDEKFKDDIEFAQKTEEAWTRILQGKGIKMDFDDLLSEMKDW